MTILEQEAVKYIAKIPEGKIFTDWLQNIVREYADVRNIKELSIETIKGRQIACDIIETEIISRLTREKADNLTEITEEYE